MQSIMPRQHYFLVLICIILCLSNSVNAARKDRLGLSKEEQKWLIDHPQIRVAYDGHFPPYSFLNENNELEGLIIDLFEIIGDRLDVEFIPHHETKWKHLYADAQKKKTDVVASMVYRPERSQWFHFTSPYILKSLVIVTREEDQRFTERDDIAGKTVALVNSYQYVNGVLRSYPTVKPYYVDTMLDALNAVATSKADAAITFMGGGHFFRTKYMLNNLKFATIYDKEESNERIAVRKDWPELSSIMEKALKSIPEREMHILRSRWLPLDDMESMIKVELSEQEKEWIAKHPVIKLGIDPEFAPFEYMENGVYSGMASDYIAILNQRLNLNMQVVEGLKWDEVIKQAQGREIDVLPAVGKTDARQDFLNFTHPYMNFHRVIITRVDNPFITSLDDIEGKSVAVQVNSSHHGYIVENSDIIPLAYDTLKGSLLAVSNGEVEAFVGNVASATYWIRTLNLTNLKVAAPVSQELQSLHFAVRKDWPELTSILQKGLDSISDRRKKKISEKWLLVEYDPVTDYSLIVKIIAAFSVLLVIIILWNMTLKRKVRQRTEQLLYNAHYDQLTDLPNRFLVQDRLSQLINEACRNDFKVAMLSIDLDDFKKVNDTLSYHIGDALLKKVAKRLSNSLPEGTTLGRLGGDQFLVLVSHINDSTELALIAESLLHTFKEVFLLGDRELALTASIGIAIFPDDAESPEILLKSAGSAMHHSKTQGNGSFAFFTEKLNQQVSRRLQLEEHMQGALERGEFELVFQPKIDSNSGLIVSFEALLRWYSRELGEVSPVEFIPIAEKNGLIEPVGLFALKEALKALAIWQQQYDKSLTIAVNLSPCQFRSKRLLPDVLNAIKTYGVESQSVELEITEGALMDGGTHVDHTLMCFEAEGIKLAIDDFGTGYSSISYLRKYTFDTLKIDREFIVDIESNESDRQLVAATIAMAHGLDMRVVAEGVETSEQHQILQQQGCDVLQGWLFSKGLPFKQIGVLLEQQSERKELFKSPV